MDRRAFLGTLAGSLLAAPLAAEGQETAKVARIGWLTGNLAANPHTRERPSFKGCVTSVTSRAATS